ncbi:hypothetical protein [Aquimarina longa]|uniref:hypothetical protein n=1 Tax=Aquimarina longa TaxID=1080221 RepID=UPI0030845CE5
MSFLTLLCCIIPNLIPLASPKVLNKNECDLFSSTLASLAFPNLIPFSLAEL